MKSNPVIECLLDHKSIRAYTDEKPTDEVIETIVRAAQQAPFASQSYSFLLNRDRSKNPWKAPLLFTICVDMYKFERIMEIRGWKRRTNDLNSIWMALQDASYAAQNLIIAGRSLGLGSCLLGAAPSFADKIAERYDLPERVFPMVQLTMGYSDEAPPCRPRYPLKYTLFEDKYPKFTDEQVKEAMKVMDEGYLAQDYYSSKNAMIKLIVDREETFDFDTYSWTEHICRKIGQRSPDPEPMMKQLKQRGFNLNWANS
jgi:nitroreductase